MKRREFIDGKKMRVLLINGSPRPKGNTSLALAEVAKQLEKNGIDSETAWIGNKPAAAVAVCRRGGEPASPMNFIR